MMGGKKNVFTFPEQLCETAGNLQVGSCSVSSNWHGVTCTAVVHSGGTVTDANAMLLCMCGHT